MKNFAFTLLLNFLILYNTYSQVTIFEDGFESYDKNILLIENGFEYNSWRLAYSVVEADDNKYVVAKIKNENAFFGISQSLEPGKTYRFSVSTKSKSDSISRCKLFIQSGTYIYKSITVSNNKDWITSTMEFTVKRGFEDVSFTVNYHASIPICIDNLKLLETTKTNAKTTRLSGIFSDGMVLQQKTYSKIWGKDAIDKKITLSTSWNNKTYEAKSDSMGNWSVSVNTPEAGGPYEIDIFGTDTIQLKDVLIGEVWLCSGQSNMQWTINAGVNNGPEVITNSENNFIRHIGVVRKGRMEPQEFVSGAWKSASPATTGHFSAVAYFFGKMLYDSLQVPIGLLNCSYGGSRIEAWMDKNTLDNLGFVAIPEKMGKIIKTPTSLYNAMIHPVIGYTVKGALWYQGEGNKGQPNEYSQLLPSMINLWRKQWGMGEFPFYFVQIAPWGNKKDYVKFWQMLSEVMLNTDNTGMAITLDVGDCKDIHPQNKKPIGERLAFWALAKDYGFKGFEYCGPVATKAVLSDNELTVYFDFAASGLSTGGKDLTGFEIAGEDKVYHSADVKLNDNNSITLSSSSVTNPRYARYGNGSCSEISPVLYNNSGLPASAFIVDAKSKD